MHEPPSPPFHILLVEDNPADVRLTEENLKAAHLSAQLSVVENGEAALAFLRRHDPYAHAPRPDLILLDMHLPRKNGYEVLAEIHQDPALRTVPVVVCLDSAALAHRLERYRLPDECIFIKGFDPYQLAHVLTRCPERSKEIR